MYDFLKFIDSPDIREYNKETQFTPAEWAVLVMAGYGCTVEEKIDALQYLVDHYNEDEFGEESINISPPTYPPYNTSMRMWDVVINTIRIWGDALRDRYKDDNAVYAAQLIEKGYPREELYEYTFFTSYEKAYSYLEAEKQEYLDDEDLRGVKTYGEIRRIGVNNDAGSDIYIFDNELRMVDIGVDTSRILCENGELLGLLDTFVYKVHVPLPFKKGDIIKVESFFGEAYYGVFSCDWERPQKKEWINMWVSLDIYDEVWERFDFTDGTGDGILNYISCSEEQLPENQKVLELISDVRKGEMDFYTLLHKYGRKELDELLEWRSK